MQQAALLAAAPDAEGARMGTHPLTSSDLLLPRLPLQVEPLSDDAMVWRVEVIKFDADTPAGRKLKCGRRCIWNACMLALPPSLAAAGSFSA